MLNIIQNTIGALARKGLSVIRNGLKMWLPFSKDGSDSSGNSNNATLYTGKALSFDGVNDYVDFGSDVNSDGTVWTTAIWISDYTAGNYDWIYGWHTKKNIGLNKGSSLTGNVFYRSSDGTYNEFSCEVFKSDFTNAKRLVFTSDGTDISLYIDGELIDTITPTTTYLKLSRLMAGYDTTNYMVAATVSDFQLYDVSWTQADVTFDYNNPQHLVTDNSASTIALSNLKGYWHLSEGDGDYAYNSAVALGSEQVVNGGFNGVASGTDVTTLSNWFLNGTPTSTDVVGEEMVIVAVASGDGARYNLATTAGSTYHLTFNASGDLGASGVNIQSLGDVSTLGGVGRKTFTAISTTTKIYFRAGDNEAGTTNYDNISAKLVSAGEINGATWDDQQVTIPQLGLMDWSKPTIGSDVVTLIADPNDPSEDILGNSVRLREHSLNLDGIGYAEVPDADSLDITSTITLECWVKWNTEDGKGLLAKWGGSNSLRSYIIEKTTNGLKFKIRVDGLGTYIAESGSITGTDWKHITCVYNGSNQTIYVDSSVSGTPESNTGAINSSNTNVEIGRAEGSNYYSELIDDVRIYDRVLSSDEVEQNYKAGLNKHKASSSFSDDFSSDYGF